MIRAVAFDLMDTVVTDPYRDALRAATGLPLEELLARRDPGAHPAFECGSLTEEDYWARYRAAGIEIDAAAFHRVRRAGLRWVPGMAELLDDLAGTVRRIVASNYPRWIDELATGLLAGRFETVLASCDIGVRKPDPAFFRALLLELELPPEAVLFVDDRAPNVAGARAVGIEAHLFERVDPLRGWLSEHGLLVADRA